MDFTKTIHYTQNMVDKRIGYQPSNSMRELIRDNNLVLMAIGRFDIAFGFGDESVNEVCRDNNVDVDTFLAVCNLLSGYHFSIDRLSLHSLMGYLMRAHTTFLDHTLPKIRYNLLEAINYSEANEVSLLLIKFFDDYVVEVKHHMDYENEVIFKYVEDLLGGIIDEDFSFAKFSGHHSHTVTKLNELKDIFIYHYKQRDNSRPSAVLYDIINCEKDMMLHFEVEKNLFVPAVERLERNVRLRLDEVNAEANKDAEDDEAPDMILGEREKDIIRCVAKGKSNKEIADELCISVHTVATHRRNIASKLGIHSAAGLTIFAIINNIVDLRDVNPHQ